MKVPWLSRLVVLLVCSMLRMWDPGALNSFLARCSQVKEAHMRFGNLPSAETVLTPAGKSTELLRRVRRHAAAAKICLMIKHKVCSAPSRSAHAAAPNPSP